MNIQNIKHIKSSIEIKKALDALTVDQIKRLGKDYHSIREMAIEFGLTIYDIRMSLAKKNLTKADIPWIGTMTLSDMVALHVNSPLCRAWR